MTECPHCGKKLTKDDERMIREKEKRIKQKEEEERRKYDEMVLKNLIKRAKSDNPFESLKQTKASTKYVKDRLQKDWYHISNISGKDAKSQRLWDYVDKLAGDAESLYPESGLSDTVSREAIGFYIAYKLGKEKNW